METILEAHVDILGNIPWRFEKITDEAISRLWGEAPRIYRILKESKSLDEARKAIYSYLNELEWEYREGIRDVHPLDKSLALEAIKVFKNIISKSNEKIATFSTLEYLRKLALDHKSAGDAVGMGFVEEFIHLFRAIHAKAGYSKGWIGEVPGGVSTEEFLKRHGREAALIRSRYLDGLADKVRSYLSRYTFGLDPKVIEKRKKNRQKILDYLGGTVDDWYDYHWHFKNIFKELRHLEDLKNLVPLTDEDIRNIRRAIENKIPFGITPYYLSLFDFERSDRKYDPQVRSQVIPPSWYVETMIKHRKERFYVFDFMRESDTTPEDLITRRYPFIAILKAADTCPQICVYCQRNWEIETAMNPHGLVPMTKIEKALEWFQNHDSMIDVLITGGDPAILGERRLEQILGRLSEFDHVKSIRIGSRIVVTIPMRVTKEFAELLGSYIEPGKRNIAFVTHVESAEEVTPDLAAAVDRLRRNGVYVYNQQVYTFETSRRFQYVLTRIALKLVGIDPYYSFYPKGKFEQRDYLVPIARLAQERKEEARLLPGIFRTDEPVFNVPALGKNHIRAYQDRELIAIMPKYGNRVYLWHPWEKGIASVDPWPYVDVPIYDYLKRLEERGEDIREYETIWYYY